MFRRGWHAAEMRLTRLFAMTDKVAARAAAGTMVWLLLLSHQALAMGEAPYVKKDVSARELLATAEKYLGTPYRFGSRDRGLDCSGFVQRVFEEHGIKLPRTSAEQSSVGEKVEWSSLRPGDLVFFHTNAGSTKVSHVGIVLGGGQMIHASTSQQRVAIDSLDLAYYVDRRVTARRLIEDPPASVSVHVYQSPRGRELLHMPMQGRGTDYRRF